MWRGRLIVLVIALAALGACEYAPSQASPGPLRTCQGELGTIGVGFSTDLGDPVGGQEYFGTSGRDVIIVASGPVTVSALGGNDLICVVDVGFDNGVGDITILGGGGDDEIYVTSAQPVSFFGGSGDDLAVGGDGDDYFNLGVGDDEAIGGGGNDSCLRTETFEGCEQTTLLEIRNYQVTEATSAGTATVTFDTTLCANPRYDLVQSPDAYNWPAADHHIVHEPSGCWEHHELRVGSWTAPLRECANYDIDVAVVADLQTAFRTPNNSFFDYPTWCDLTLELNVVGKTYYYEGGYLVNPVAAGPSSTTEYCLVEFYDEATNVWNPCNYTVAGGVVGEFQRIDTTTGYNDGSKCYWVVAIENAVRVGQSSNPVCNETPADAGPYTIRNIQVAGVTDAPGAYVFVTLTWDYLTSDNPAEWRINGTFVPGTARQATFTLPSGQGGWSELFEFRGWEPGSPDARPSQIFGASGPP